MFDSIPEDRFFEKLAADLETSAVETPAPSRVKSRIYSAIVLRQMESGPLLSVSRTKSSGRKLCVFEDLVHIAPVGEEVKSLNFCRVCHARILAEKIERAPIYWPGCPYVRFQNR